MLGLLGGGENVCGWLFMMELFTLGVSLHKKMTDPATQTAEPVVILTEYQRHTNSILKNTVFRGKARHPSRKLALKNLSNPQLSKLIQCSWINEYQLDPRLAL